ncbi:MAG: cysteine--tRNA ligase [Planctomycetaceae bacterium]
MTLRVYNTLSREKEDFQPLEPGKVGMYLCGPTVYKPAHIGHMVGPVIFDTVKRYLSYIGYDVTFVINITDVDDKLINKANELGITVEELAKQMTEDYFDNLQLMGVDSVDYFPYATDHISEMQEMIAKLIEQDYAYPLDGDVYFHVPQDEDYGKLSHRNIDEVMAGTRVDANDKKRHPADFALWKKAKPGEPSWDSPWGPGRPGWHIECSVMSGKLLGESFDIHGGGLDLMFPHHENELAQSESCHGKPFAKYWMHNGLMQASSGSKVGGQHDRSGDISTEDQVANKLAGSAGAESVKTAVFAHYPPETVRFFLLNTHYRSPIDFSLERIGEVGKGLESFYRLFETFERITGTDFYALTTATSREQSVPLEGEPAEFFAQLKDHRDRFLEAMDDDFNTGGAIGVLFELRKTIGAFISQRKLDMGERPSEEETGALIAAMQLLKELAGILGVFRKPVEKAGDDGGAFAGDLMQLIIDVRSMARESKQWDIADKIRDRLNELEVTLEDRPEGTIWRRG